jgi:hypothetical protein
MYSENLPAKGPQRLSGDSYEAIHPELKGVNPEDYPDINKLSILADVAPYSREYNIFRQAVASQSEDNTEMRIEYERILERVRQTKESVIRMQDRVSPSCRNQKPRTRSREEPATSLPTCRQESDAGTGTLCCVCLPILASTVARHLAG